MTHDRTLARWLLVSLDYAHAQYIMHTLKPWIHDIDASIFGEPGIHGQGRHESFLMPPLSNVQL